MQICQMFRRETHMYAHQEVTVFTKDLSIYIVTFVKPHPVDDVSKYFASLIVQPNHNQGCTVELLPLLQLIACSQDVRVQVSVDPRPV